MKNKIIWKLAHSFHKYYKNIPAEDFYQEAVLEVLKKKNRFDPEKSSESTWTYTIARQAMVKLTMKFKESAEIPEYVINNLITEQTHNFPVGTNILQNKLIKYAMEAYNDGNTARKCRAIAVKKLIEIDGVPRDRAWEILREVKNLVRA